MVQWKTQTLELMKVLSDPRRNQILHLAESPVTVKDLAEEIEEKPSRLYYHVNKLLEVGLLEVVDTKLHGNLTEKYYQAKDNDVFYKGDLKMMAENMPYALAALYNTLDPGVKLYEKALKAVQEQRREGKSNVDKYPYQVSFSRWSDRTTGKEWSMVFDKMLKAMGKLNEDDPGAKPHVHLTPEEEEEIGTYQYVLLSYRIEDAEKLGLMDPENEDSQKH